MFGCGTPPLKGFPYLHGWGWVDGRFLVNGLTVLDNLSFVYMYMFFFPVSKIIEKSLLWFVLYRKHRVP